MKSSLKILLVSVYLLVLLAVPSFTIYKSNKVLKDGEVYRFDIFPVDPYDPFRGAYVTLRFQENRVFVPNRQELKGEKEVYLIIETDEKGYVKVIDAVKKVPINKPYLKTDLRYEYPQSDDELVKINIKYAFNRYYLDQENAKLAERVMRFRTEKRVEKSYVDVRILEGKGVIEELYFDDIPVIDYLKKLEDGE